MNSVRLPRWMIVTPPEGAARTVMQALARGFEQLRGVDSRSFDTGVYLQAFDNLQKKSDPTISVDLLNQSLMVAALDWEADTLLVGSLAPVTLFALSLLRRQGVRTIHWFFEDYRRATYWRDVVEGYDLFAAIQHGDLEATCRRRGVPYAFVPTAGLCRTAHLPAPGSPARWDAVFVGLASEYRFRMIKKMKAAGIGIVVAGSGWSAYAKECGELIVGDGWIPPEKAAQMYAAARVGLNLSLQDPVGDRHNAQISPRVFDIIAAGAVLVCEDLALCREVLEGYYYRTFSDSEELVRVIRIECERGVEVSSLLRKNSLTCRRQETWTERAGRFLRLEPGIRS